MTPTYFSIEFFLRQIIASCFVQTFNCGFFEFKKMEIRKFSIFKLNHTDFRYSFIISQSSHIFRDVIYDLKMLERVNLS